MVTVKIGCVGISPILMDRMTDETLESLRTGVRKTTPRDVAAEKVAVGKIYREDGDASQIGLPQELLFASLSRAGRNVKNGKKQVSTVTSSTLSDFLSIQDIFIPFTNIKGKGDGSWKVDKRRGRLQDGTAVCVVRPRFEKWEFMVTVDYDETKIDESTLRRLFENAGSAQGLGSFRPNCKGSFGRFKIASWEIAKN